MLLVTNDNKLSCHFTLTPVGWALIALAKNDVYQIPSGDALHLRVARVAKAEGANHFRPVWVINKIGPSIVTIDWVNDHEQTCTPEDDIRNVLRDLDDQCDLHLTNVVEEGQCQTNFHLLSTRSVLTKARRRAWPRSSRAPRRDVLFGDGRSCPKKLILISSCNDLVEIIVHARFLKENS